MPGFVRWFAACGAVGFLAALGALGPGRAIASEVDASKIPAAITRTVDFREDVYPLLEKRCFSCHRGSDASSGARLDLRSSVLGETNGRSLAVPGRSAESRLIHMVSGALEASENKIMPPKGDRLTHEEIGLLRAWIDQNVAWDDELLPPIGKGEEARHWAFQRIERPAIPVQESAQWGRNPIDAFVARGRGETGLEPVAPASPAPLIRRLYMTLIGLPPTPEEVRAFEADASPTAYENLVERLLASPAYGERWGRHWLDVARFAESEGFNQNVQFRTAWRYRDYVVKSFNEDKPFTEFVSQQLAGDEIEPYSDENLIATGFISTARLSGDDIDIVKVINDMQVDVVNTTASALLGLTLECAQCHDHKFDPVTALDYYRLQAFFVNGLPGHVLLRGSGDVPPPNPELETAARDLIDFKVNTYNRVLAEAYLEEDNETQRIMHIPESHRTMEEESVYRTVRGVVNIRLLGCNQFRYSESEKKRLAELTALVNKHRGPGVNEAWGFYSPVTSPHILRLLPKDGNTPVVHDLTELYARRGYLLRRGSPLDPAKAVQPGFPAIVAGADVDNAVGSKRPRLELAKWLTSERNPLTARVWVNRIWHYHFGRGIVKTPGNFGTRGDRPSHPDLLDWLASEFMSNGWSTKHIHRLILQSSTFRLSSTSSAVGLEKDRDNDTYWRWSRRRLESEVVRDSILSVCETLDRRMGGPSAGIGQESSRRSLYLSQTRDIPPEMQALFDGPTAMSASCAERTVSTTSLQPLYLLNNPHSVQRASGFANRVRRVAGDDLDQQVSVAFQLALGRAPTAGERAQSRAFLVSGADRKKPTLVTRALSLWLRSDKGVGSEKNRRPVPLKNGDPVTIWRDQLVGDNRVANDLRQRSTTRSPRFISNPMLAIHGRPVLRFSGVRDQPYGTTLSCNEVDELDFQDAFSMFVVLRFQKNAEPGAHQAMLVLEQAGDKSKEGAYSLGRFHGAKNEDGKPHDKMGRLSLRITGEKKDGFGEQIFSTQGIAGGGPIVMAVRFGGRNIELDILSPGNRVCVDNAPFFDRIRQGASRFTVGGYDALSEIFEGDIGEILIYRDRLSDQEKEAVLGVLEERWKLGFAPQPRLAALCQAILNLNEFLYIE